MNKQRVIVFSSPRSLRASLFESVEFTSDTNEVALVVGMWCGLQVLYVAAFAAVSQTGASFTYFICLNKK